LVIYLDASQSLDIFKSGMVGQIFGKIFGNFGGEELQCLDLSDKKV